MIIQIASQKSYGFETRGARHQCPRSRAHKRRTTASEGPWVVHLGAYVLSTTGPQVVCSRSRPVEHIAISSILHVNDNASSILHSSTLYVLYHPRASDRYALQATAVKPPRIGRRVLRPGLVLVAEHTPSRL